MGVWSFLQRLFGTSSSSRGHFAAPEELSQRAPYVEAAIRLSQKRSAGDVEEDTFREALRGLEDPPIIAERSCTRSEDSCDTCPLLDGIRVLVGTNIYSRVAPPNMCEHGEACTCIASYIMPEERGYPDQVFQICRNGGWASASGKNQQKIASVLG